MEPTSPSQKVIVIDDLIDELDRGETIGIYYLTKRGDDMLLPRLGSNNRQKGWQRKPEWRDQSNRHSRKCR